MEEMNEHTPGPWRQSGTVIYSPNTGVICELSTVHPADQAIHHVELELGSDDWDEAMANGALIKAAPDLLTACRYWLDQGRFLVANCDAYDVAVAMLRAAITKATGKGEIRSETDDPPKTGP
jgi:hypothetical protein